MWTLLNDWKIKAAFVVLVSVVFVFLYLYVGGLQEKVRSVEKERDAAQAETMQAESYIVKYETIKKENDILRGERDELLSKVDDKDPSCTVMPVSFRNFIVGVSSNATSGKTSR